MVCLTHPGSIGLSTSACLQCRTTCAVVKGKSCENLVEVDRTRTPRCPRATARWSTSREHTPGVFCERLSLRGHRHPVREEGDADHLEQEPDRVGPRPP